MANMMLRAAAIAIVLLGLLPAIAGAAPDLQPYRIDPWQVADGLPQSSVLTIVQTHDGYLWMGTAGGLVRFDGVDFKVFTPNNAPGLPSNRILSLFEDQAGTLWIGTIEGYLVRYTHDRFEVCSPADWVKLSGYIQGFAESGDGRLWLINPDKNLMRFSADRAHPDPAAGQLLQTNVGSITQDGGGRIWSASDTAVGVWNGDKFSKVLDLVPSTEFSPTILAGSRGGGCWVAANGRLRKFLANRCVADYGPYPWSKGAVVCALEDNAGQVWVGTYGSGVYCYDTNGAARSFSTAAGLPGDFIRSLCEDHEGNIWVGTDGSGMARIKPVVFRSFGRQQGLSGDCVMSVCEGRDGDMWIGLIADGVDRLKDGKVRHYDTANGLPNNFINAVLYDRSQTLWAGTWGGGLCCMEGGQFVSKDVPDRNTVVCAMLEDSRGGLWIGGQRSKPEIVHLVNGHSEVVPLNSRLAGTDIRALAEGKDGSIWVGTQGDGLYRLNDGRQTHFGRGDGLSNEAIRSLYVDAGGVLWIATFGGGLDRFKDGKFASFTTKNGLPNDSLGYIVDDAAGNLWCGSLGGIFRVAKDELDRFARGETQWIQCLLYTTSDGLPSIECNGGTLPSGCKTRDQQLWFPTVRGIAVVDPGKIPVNRLPPPVVIEQVVVEGRERRIISDVMGFANPDQRSMPLRIPPGVQRLEFHYAGLSFTEPKKVRFKYKLEGLDEDWVEAGTRRTAYYTYLRPANYRFRVQACNNDGIWNEQGVSLPLILLPHFWQTWWFKALCACAVILVFVGIYELRLASERALTRIRLRIASDLHDEVGSNLGSIALMSEMMPKGGEEADEIRRVAVQTAASLREIVWFLDPAGDDANGFVLRMKDTARMLLHGVTFEFLSAGETDGVRLPLNLRRNVFPMFKEILHNIAKHAGATHVKIEVKIAARQIRLQVEDNGTGFDEARVRRGNGLKNLRRRTAELRGELKIESRPGKGARITLTAPLT
jgi:ligand-binding sensor domain-containing protein